jgi:hypothetical protein
MQTAATEGLPRVARRFANRRSTPGGRSPSERLKASTSSFRSHQACSAAALGLVSDCEHLVLVSRSWTTSSWRTGLSCGRCSETTSRTACTRARISRWAKIRRSRARLRRHRSDPWSRLHRSAAGGAGTTASPHSRPLAIRSPTCRQHSVHLEATALNGGSSAPVCIPRHSHCRVRGRSHARPSL